MTGEPDLVSLLYHADWTRLRLSAEVSDGSSLLIAPGRRYRLQTPDHLTGCDGDRAWELSPPGEADGAGGTVHWISGRRPPLPRLLRPAWLLTGSRLDVTGRVSACGRDALHVVATGKPGPGGGSGPRRFPGSRAEAVVDAELGIVLRLTWMASGGPPGSGASGPPEVLELASLDLSPVIGPAQFAPPPGSLPGESLSESLSGGGLAWQAVKTVGGLAAGGLGAWIRYSPSGHRRSGTPDMVEAIPADDPAPGLSADGRPSGPAVSTDILHLLHAGGAAGFAATRHQWVDIGAMLSQIPAGPRRSGFGGLGLLADSIAELPSASGLVSGLRLGGPGQYQIDHRDDPGYGPVTVACDGQRRWEVYRDRVTVGPAERLPGELADLADASWLLECRLSGGEHIIAGGRPAYRINVTRGDAEWSLPLMFPAVVAVVDAELGIVLRLTSYLGGKPVRRDELRDLTVAAGDFAVNIPPGLPVSEEIRPYGQSGSSHPASVTLQVASILARQAATGTAKAVRGILRRIGPG